MDKNREPAIFDGHNDVLLRLFNMGNKDACHVFLDGDGKGHLDLPRMVKGGFGGGLFAIYVPSPEDADSDHDEMNNPPFDLKLPAEIPVDEALPIVLSMAATLLRIERESKGRAKICRTAGEVEQCLQSGTLAMVMHIEGAEAIDDDFNALEVLYAAGLRSVGPVWSRPTRFAHGVPFRYPGSPDTGAGLSDLGKAFIRELNRLKMQIDLSHLNEAGFWDVAKLSDAPLVATHSNAHALCANTRNLTDKQLSAIGESGGMVGVNFATAFIREDGKMSADTSIDDMLRHMDHLIDHVGIEGVGFGSDFDGATIPRDIGDVAGLVPLRKAMRAHGYDEETMTRLCHGNWVRVLRKTFGQ